MQFYTMGILIGLYCFIHYVQTPIERLRASEMRLTDMSYTATILPVLILAHYIPNYCAYAWNIEPQTRHKWEWIWQGFPVAASVAQFVLKTTVMPNTIDHDRKHATERDIPTIKFTILSLCALSAATWHYTAFFAPHSMLTIFVPDVAATKTGDEFLRLFLQFDQICSMAACFLWLLYLFGDLKAAGMMEASWLSIVGRGLPTFVLGGPGVAFGLGWLWREDILATRWQHPRLAGKQS